MQNNMQKKMHGSTILKVRTSSKLYVNMSICPRCGKVMCSEQSLQYHLNRKTPCNSLHCIYCKSVCLNKFNKIICEKKCYNTITLMTNKNKQSPPLLVSKTKKKSQDPNSTPFWCNNKNTTSPPKSKGTQTSPKIKPLLFSILDN